MSTTNRVGPMDATSRALLGQLSEGRATRSDVVISTIKNILEEEARKLGLVSDTNQTEEEFRDSLTYDGEGYILILPVVR